MSAAFVDTSAFIAILNADDINHRKAKKIFEQLCVSNDGMVTHNYVVVETFAVLQARIGMDCVRAFEQDILPVVNVAWIAQADHEHGIHAVLAANRREISLVDCVSFGFLRRSGLRTVFCFDRHFADQGFEVLKA